MKYENWSEVPPSDWHWPNFTPKEMACKGTGTLVINKEFMDCLQKLRIKLGKPLIILSGYRSPTHNKKIGGAKSSQHLTGNAVDVAMWGHNRDAFVKAAKQCGFTGFGFYPTYIHIDLGNPRTWDKK